MQKKIKRLTLYILASWLAFAFVVAPIPHKERAFEPWEISPAFAQFGGNIPLDVQLCPTVGAIAVRNATRWQCVAPGSAAQVFISNGPGAVPGWTTPAGTGNVNASGTPTNNQIPIWTNATTIKGMSAGGALLDLVNGASTTGYEKRTATGTYTWASIPVADLPALTGSDCAVAAGAGAISCAGMLTQTHTWTATQNYGNVSFATQGGMSSVPSGSNGVYVGWNNTGGTAEIDFWNLFIGTPSQGGYSFRQVTGSGTQTNLMDLFTTSYGGLKLHVPFAPDNPVGVAYGGTGATVGGGAALDNVVGYSGLGATGIWQRLGNGSWGLSSISQILDSITTTQGSILYRNASGWVSLPPASTAGQVLASQGSGANPQWVAPGTVTPGTRVLLNTLTVTAGASALTDTTSISSSYNEYEIDCENVFPTANTSQGLLMQVQQAGAFTTSGYGGAATSVSNTGSSSGLAPSTAILFGGGYVASSTSFAGLTFSMRFSNPLQTGVKTYFTGYGGAVSSASAYTSQVAAWAPLGAITGFQLTFSGTTFAGGACKVYAWN